MRKSLSMIAIALVCAAAAFAEVKQPKPKSQKEVDALVAVQNATAPDARIAAINNTLENFADTEFKPMLLLWGTAAYEQKSDWDNVIVWGERVLEVDPQSYQAMLMLSNAYVRRTKEYDLDKEDKLSKAEGYANKALAALKTAEKPRPDVTDEQWEGAKKQLNAQAHELLGSASMSRKSYEKAIAEYKEAISIDPQATTTVRLAAAYNAAKKPDEALPLVEKLMAAPDTDPTIKSFAQAERARALQMKNGANKPATTGAPPSAPAPVPVSPTPQP